MEILVLRKDNIHEVAQKVGRDPIELELEYYYALRLNQVVMFCIDIVEIRLKGANDE